MTSLLQTASPSMRCSSSYRSLDVELASRQAEFRVSSARYASQAFLDEKHYKTLHQTLSRKWDHLQSLSAAVKLMQKFGVELSLKEREALAKKDPPAQIEQLVSMLPRQSGAEFEFFFAQLQSLVSSATRMRNALEVGDWEDVAQALEDAEKSGTMKYLTQVSAVQFGSKATSMKAHLDDWRKKADKEMARLLRITRGATNIKKEISCRKADLAHRREEVNVNSFRVTLAFAMRLEQLICGTVFNAWASHTRDAQAERRARSEYDANLDGINQKILEWKMRHSERARHVLGQQWMHEQALLRAETFAMWRGVVEEAIESQRIALQRADGQQILESASSSQRERRLAMMKRFAGLVDQDLLQLGFAAFAISLREARAVLESAKVAGASQTKRQRCAKFQRQTTARMMGYVATSSDLIVLREVFGEWCAALARERSEGLLFDTLSSKQFALHSLESKAKASAASALSRAGGYIEEMLLLRVMNAFRMYAQMEIAIRMHQSKVDRKRHQLQGVQNMFRDFAKTLEAGVIDDARSTAALRDHVYGGRRLSRTEMTQSLPEIRSDRLSRPPSSSGRHAPQGAKGAPPSGRSDRRSAPHSGRTDSGRRA
mmetsp:Transcript_61099/g.177120  ORF Transcript_61099/g.177120 Transcript_61099/m.177120 type:complete len:603 (+) Transcript_61099:76-1884(+)